MKIDKCVMAHLGFDVSDNNIQNQMIQIHEHNFIRKGVKAANNLLIQCSTCGIHYCNLCGRALERGTCMN
jgi:hypothetical protein